MSDAGRIHNENVGRLVKEIWRLSGQDVVQLNIFAESLLVGVAMLNYPADARRQALLIQDISDGAQDRARSVGDR